MVVPTMTSTQGIKLNLVQNKIMGQIKGNKINKKISFASCHSIIDTIFCLASICMPKYQFKPKKAKNCIFKHEKMDVGKIILIIQEFKILKLPFLARFDPL